MKNKIYKFGKLSCFFAILLVIACKKEGVKDKESENLYTLNLKLDGFTSSKKPYYDKLGAVNKWASMSGIQQNSDDYLFFWSFNEESLTPDLSIPSTEATSISYNDGLTPANYVNSTYTHGNYPGGKALSVTGGKEFILEIPMIHIQQLTSFAFDIGSTSTGPKDFEISYSWDGIDYDLIEAENQFASGVTNSKISYTYDLSSLNNFSARLWIKLEFKAGDRTGAGTYNPTSGVFRIDNIRLQGTYELSTSADISKLHYYIFHQDNPDIFSIGEVDEANWGSFDVQLPSGNYDLFLISNQSNMELIVPTANEAWSNIFASNYFVNGQAEIFGLVDEIQVSQDESLSFSLDRMYSQIKFEFTDNDLSAVEKIIVTPLHEPHYFDPAGTIQNNPIVDQTELQFDSGIQENKQIVFNQFLGLLSDEAPISYQLDVYTEGEIARTLTVTSNIKNNMQVVFQGKLLQGLAYDFIVTKNEAWDGELFAEF